MKVLLGSTNYQNRTITTRIQSEAFYYRWTVNIYLQENNRRNIFVKENEISGFIDIGKMGPADRWQDIAIAIRSLKHNFDGKYTDGKKIFNFKPQMFLDALGVDFDNQKYKYYFLLDELF